jgi:hypothetical protein
MAMQLDHKLSIYEFVNLVVLLMALVVGAVGVDAATNDKGWYRFLADPDGVSYFQLRESIAESAQQCGWGRPTNRLVISVAAGQKLFKLVSEGNEFAFRAGLLVTRCLDGGELEDFYRSGGIFFDIKPALFLRIVEEECVQRSIMKSMLTMLPLDTVDNIDRAIEVVEIRIAKLDAISGSRYEDIRDAGLSFLEEQKSALYRIREHEQN